MIGTIFTYEGVEYTVESRVEGTRSYLCAQQAGDSITLSTRAINKLLGKTTTRIATPLGEDAAVIQIESVLSELDPVTQVRVVRDMAVRYLEEKPGPGQVIVDGELIDIRNGVLREIAEPSGSVIG